jgi:HSP20 family protein
MVNEKSWTVRELKDLRLRLADLVETALLPASSGPFPTAESRFDPPLDLYETDDAVVVEMELPGIDATQVAVNIVDNTLIVSGRAAEPEPGGVFFRIERPRGAFGRAIPIPVHVTATSTARLRHGVLEVTLVKSPAARRRVVALTEES